MFGRTAATPPPPRCRVAVSAGVRADNTVCECEHHELGACLELELAHDVRAMRIDRADGDEELRGDLLVRVAEREQMDDVALSLGQRLESATVTPSGKRR